MSWPGGCSLFRSMQLSRVLLILLAACGGTRYRTELVGHGNAGDGIQLPQGNYELAMRFEVPRAQVVDWKIVCPGVDIDGQVGETFPQYRTRRLTELARDREADVAAANVVIG